MEPVIIVEAKSIVRLGRFQRLWVAGWCVASLALVTTAVQSARLYEARKNAQELSKLMAQVRSVQEDQKAVNDTYIQAWQNQLATANLVVTWGQYIKDRDDIVAKNKNSAPSSVAINYIKR